jgi:hypothetical protein
VKRFYDPTRGDVILNPLDKRCPYWGPAEEPRSRSEAKALAASLFQPPQERKGEFFIESPQKLFAFLMAYGPTPDDLVQWMSNPDEIDRRLKGTEHAHLIDPRAHQQRAGVLGSLGLVADSLRLLPKREEGNGAWTATEWAEKRQGWVFIASLPAEREALRPLQSLWIDWLVLRLLNEPTKDQKRVWFVIDELASLQKLPQLHTAITEGRKGQNPVVLGFHGKTQLEYLYGHLAEVMLSQPATSVWLTTKEPNAGEWVSKFIGKVEIERLSFVHDRDEARAPERLERPAVFDQNIRVGRQPFLASRTHKRKVSHKDGSGIDLVKDRIDDGRASRNTLRIFIERQPIANRSSKGIFACNQWRRVWSVTSGFNEFPYVAEMAWKRVFGSIQNCGCSKLLNVILSLISFVADRNPPLLYI